MPSPVLINISGHILYTTYIFIHHPIGAGMRKRPELKVGDVCRFSAKGRKMYPDMRNATLTVKVVGSGDTTEASTSIRVMCVYTDRRYGKIAHDKVVKRQYLWFTGYNSASPNASSTKRSSGRPCSCDMQIIMSRGCACGGN